MIVARQDRICAPGARLRYLVGIDDEVLPQTGQLGRGTGRGQVLERAGEEPLVGQDGQRGRAGGRIAARERGDVIVAADLAS